MKTRVLAHRVWASRKLSVPDFPIPWFLRASRFSKWRHHFQNVKEKGNFLLGKPPNVKERKTSLREFPKSWKSENLKFSIFENPENFKNVKEKGNLLLRKSPNSEILNPEILNYPRPFLLEYRKFQNPQILKFWNCEILNYPLPFFPPISPYAESSKNLRSRWKFRVSEDSEKTGVLKIRSGRGDRKGKISIL